MPRFHRQVNGRCPCGAPGASCGPPSTSVALNVDHIKEAAMGGPLRKYRVTVGSTETVMKLNPADADRLGGVPIDTVPEEEAASDEGPAPEAKARTGAANKARTGVRNKAVGGGGD